MPRHHNKAGERRGGRLPCEGELSLEGTEGARGEEQNGRAMVLLSEEERSSQRKENVPTLRGGDAPDRLEESEEKAPGVNPGSPQKWPGRGCPSSP